MIVQKLIRLTLILAIGSAGGFCLAQTIPAVSGIGGTEKLVPATYKKENDQKGNSWNVQQNGNLGRGNNSMWSAGMQLFVNQNQFYNYQPMMTADGKEYVLTHAHPTQMAGLEVTRRIRVLDKEGAVAYLEVFHNPGGQAVQTFVEIRSGFGTKMKTYVSDRGNQNITAMGKKERGLLIVPSSTSSTYQSLIFSICAAGAQEKPTLSNQNMYQLGLHYNLNLDPGQTQCLLHVVTQLKTPTDLTQKNVGKLFKSFDLKRYVRYVRPEYRAKIANFNAGAGEGALSLLAGTSVDGLGVDRARSDVLALGDKTRLLGSSSCSELKIVTEYGGAVIPFENVSALVGSNRGRSTASRVFLRDGQAFTGEITASDLRFILPSGSRMELDMGSLDRLVRSEVTGEGTWGPNVVALLETFEGDRIAMEGGVECILSAHTPWGALDFSLDDVLSITPPDEEPVGHWIEFLDGSRFFAYLADKPVTVVSNLFGQQALNSGRIRAIVTGSLIRRSKEKDEAKPAIGALSGSEGMQQSHLRLAGGQLLVGRINAPVIHALTNAEMIEIAPENIRLMHSTRDDGEEESAAGEFRIELWGGGVILGGIRESVLPVLVRGQIWQIPASDIVDVITPAPRISDEMRQKIAGLIRDLGSPEWEVRDAATGSLAEFGFMAKSMLMEGLNVTPDAEVRQRIEKLLGEME